MDKQSKQSLNDLLGVLIGVIVGFMLAIIIVPSDTEPEVPLQSPIYLKQMSCSQLEDSLETASSEMQQNIYISNLMILKRCWL